MWLEFRIWLKKNSFSRKNFCGWLLEILRLISFNYTLYLAENNEDKQKKHLGEILFLFIYLFFPA